MCFFRSMLQHFFALVQMNFDSCSNEVFPSPMFLCIPLHCKQTLKPEGQLLGCSNLKATPQAVTILLPVWLLHPPEKLSLSSACFCEHPAPDMFSVQCSCVRAGTANLLPQLQVFNSEYKGKGYLWGRETFSLFSYLNLDFSWWGIGFWWLKLSFG